MVRWITALAIGSGVLAAPAPAPVYQVYAVRYATLVGFPKQFLVLGADSTKLDLAMMVWVAKGSGHTILVDAGFYRDEFMKQWKPTDYAKPSEAVARLGIKPEDVTDIIITHSHWDHADGADLFPKAKVWLQKTEYEFYRDPANLKNSGVFPADMKMFAEIEQAGRLGLVAGDSQQVAPGVFVYTGGRHTKESQFVSVPIAGGTVVLASDNMYLYENLDRHRPITATWDSVSNLAAQDRMKRLASTPRLIVPGHDVLVFKRFPPAGPDIVAIR
jgi:glyoxylase-like metal-dependent hydrolase (beta-lactamase superfamily II)